MDTSPKTHYEVLDLDRDATEEEVRAAYRRLARECHPDVAGDDPQAAATFRRLSEAHRVLTDPERKRAYDRTLPQKSYPLRHPTPAKIWREATEVVLMRSDRFGPVNEAMQAAVSIAWQDDLLVVGLAGRDHHLAGHLTTPAHRNAILNALELVVGRRQDLRVIFGTTQEDWEAAQARDAAAAPRAEAVAARPPAARPAAPEAAEVWDGLVQRVHRSFQTLPQRQYPQVRARFLQEAIGWVLQTEDEVRALGEPSSEATERALARVLERIGAVVDLPPTQVALELQRVRRV